MVALSSFFDQGWRSNPSGLAFVSSDESWTFDEAGQMTNRIANGLIDIGASKGAKVGVLAPNTPLAWLCVLAAWRAGAIWVPLNPDHPVDEIASLLSRFDVDVLIFHPSLDGKMQQIKARSDTVSSFICLASNGVDVDLTQWAEQYEIEAPDVDIASDDIAVIAPTGGTTGAPKGVMNTHRGHSVMVAHQTMALQYGPHDRHVNLAAAPMTHSAGFASLQASARGATVVTIPRASVEPIVEAIEKYGVTEMFLPPTVIYRLLDHLRTRSADLSTLRYILYGASPMSTEKLRQGIEMLGPVFLEGYGQMEAPASICLMRPDEHLNADGSIASDYRLAACGRPSPLNDVTVRDPVTFEVVQAGHTGEICVRGDLVMKGYYKDPEKTAEAIVGGWLRTGDLGHLDGAGYLHITDRSKDLIITGGFNVYPSEVEQVIWTHPAVMDCAVIGVPDADWGERVIAVVETNPGKTVTEDELRVLCREKLGAVRTPKCIVFAALPRSANGKVLKKEVRSLSSVAEAVPYAQVATEVKS